MERFAAIAREITALTGTRCAPAPQRRVTGGSINECYCWHGDAGAMFVKLAPLEARSMFAAEAAGLAELERSHAVRVPRVLASGHTERTAFLALEWIEAGVAGPECEARLGRELAALHAVTAPRFGWLRDNTIGRTPQANAASDDWAEFFRERRLRPQLELAASHGFAELLATPGERLLESVQVLLAGHRPAASLLHGDLWGGNWLAALSGEPVLIDPAVYYGDRETDLAMTRLFGGFGERFYQAYQAAAPLAPAAQARAELYNLYHVLNHANLFGGGYARQARAIIEHLLAQARG
ncbi:MAG TPA: fructosamine kinase family protein [Steroidobacteraceae bacterium]|nr:fructosamine kinase family protein [Steroidobacteraceae bacterium]